MFDILAVILDIYKTIFAIFVHNPVRFALTILCVYMIGKCLALAFDIKK